MTTDPALVAKMDAVGLHLGTALGLVIDIIDDPSLGEQQSHEWLSVRSLIEEAIDEAATGTQR